MPLRVIEIITPEEDAETVRSSLEDRRDEGNYVFWGSRIADSKDVAFKMIMNVQESESVLDRLEKIFSFKEKYRVVVYPAEATLPRLPLPQENNGNGSEEGKTEEVEDKGRISREELYADVLDASYPTKGYILMTSLAAVAAVIGLYQDNMAVIIGAMVLAPLLGPNVGLALAATLGDMKLFKVSLKSLAFGVAACLVLSFAAGLMVDFPLSSAELMNRTRIGYPDVLLAFVSGAAAIVSMTLAIPGSLVGVMVALALLPPLAACGVFLGMGSFADAANSALLFAANVICLNLAGIGAFLLQGLRPLSWWEAKRAKKMAALMSVVWTLLLLALMTLIAYKKSLFIWPK